jgi:hypothetical protein
MSSTAAAGANGAAGAAADERVAKLQAAMAKADGGKGVQVGADPFPSQAPRTDG